MKLQTKFAITFVLITTAVAFQNFSFPPDTQMPPSVPARIGRLQVFTQNIQDTSVLKNRDFIWGDTLSAKVIGPYSTSYMPSDRDPFKANRFTCTGAISAE